MPIDLAPPLWLPPTPGPSPGARPAIIRSAGDLNRHDRRAIEREFGVSFPEPQKAAVPGTVPVVAPEVAAAGITLVDITTAVQVSGDDWTHDLSGMGLQEDDVVLVAFCMDAAGSQALDDGSWTEIWNSVTTSTVCALVGGKVMTSTPDTEIGISVGGGFDQGCSIAIAFRVVNSSPSQDVTATTTSGSSGDPDAPSITPVTDGCAIVAFGFLDDDIITSCSLSGFDDVTFETDSNGSQQSSVMVGWTIQETAGAINPPAFVTDGDDAWKAISIALRPAA